MIRISTLYEKEQIRNYLVAYQHLSDDTMLQSTGEIVEYVRKVGCIQYDPLNVVGKNPDLVLQARCREYRKGEIDACLYTDRTLFDVWDKNMSISAVSDWPCFGPFRERFVDWCSRHQTVIDEITGYLQAHEYACSSDFAHHEKVDWHYGPQRLAKAALEAMCYAGLAVVHHKKGTRRYYGLAERHIPEQDFYAAPPFYTEEEYYKWFVLRRMNAVGLLWNKPSDAWLGIRGFKSGQRLQAFHSLLQEEKIVEIPVSGMKSPLYISAENAALLQASTSSGTTAGAARILAPLDNLLWDRKLVAELFGFEYKWEVYTPAANRRYGYYVLPVLCGNQLIARVEMETDESTQTLVVKQLWMQDGAAAAEYAGPIHEGLAKFQVYNGCNQTKCCFTL